MIQLGFAADFLVAILLGLGQLIEPLPPEAIAKAKLITEYKDKCEQQNDPLSCATEQTRLQVLSYQPKSFEQLLSLNNAELINELHLICLAVQDRIFQEQEDLLNGKVADRDEMASKLVVLQKPEITEVASNILLEAKNGDLKMNDLFRATMSICHWKVNRAELAKKVDFTPGLKFLQEILDELPKVDRLPPLPQANFIFDVSGERVGEVYDSEFITRAGKRYLSKVHRRRTVTPSEVPERLLQAFIAIEDKRFIQHKGFDFDALKRLYYGGVQGSKQGGSTFTMQLIKNAFFDDDVEKERETGRRTLRRKLKEIMMIPFVEGKYSKKEILTYYLNLIDLTPDAQGIKMASMDLFGIEDLHQLNLAQMALLAAMPKGTSKYNPRKSPAEAKLRRDTVLRVMEEQGFITLAEKEKFQAEPLNLVANRSTEPARIASRFFIGHLKNQFKSLREENRFDSRWQLGGLDIQSSLDLKLQEQVTDALGKGLMRFEEQTRGRGVNGSRSHWQPWLSESTRKNVNIRGAVEKRGSAALSEILAELRAFHPYPETNWVLAVRLKNDQNLLTETGQTVPVLSEDRGLFARLSDYDVVLLDPDKNYRFARAPIVQGAAIVIDIRTGEVKAISGGFTAGPFGKFAQNNRATNSYRQPGSTIKAPLYLYALERGFEPNTLLRDEPVAFPKSKACPFVWSPKNYSGGGGQMTLRDALARSSNRTVLQMFTRLAGVSGSNFIGAAESEINQLYGELGRIHEFLVNTGFYPKRTELPRWIAKAQQNLCFPYLLGGYETTPMHVAQNYSMIANGGLRREALFLKEVKFGDQPLVVDRTFELASQVREFHTAMNSGVSAAPEAFGLVPGVTPQSVAQLRSILQSVVSDGTARRIAEWAPFVGGKTGTTNSNKDAWFVGFNQNIAVAVWVGYDDAKMYPDLGDRQTGGAVALPIFQQIMESYYSLYPDMRDVRLTNPAEIPGLVAVKVNSSTGRCEATANSGVVEFLKEKAIENQKQCLAVSWRSQ